jgi:hypothetical protein
VGVRYGLRPAGGGEGAGYAEEDDLLAGGEGVGRDLLQLIVLVEPPELAVGDGVADADWSHGRPRECADGEGDEELAERLR